MYTSIVYIIYLLFALVSVLVVGRLLYTNGKFYLVEIFHDEKIADAVNRFLITGYCLVNVGGAFRCLHKTNAIESFQKCIEYVFINQGELFLLLGIMHCMNLIFLPLLKPIFKQQHNHSNDNQQKNLTN